jgi:hypothetical protein
MDISPQWAIIYFGPNNNGTSHSGTVLRFDTTGNFTSSGSWSAYDAGSTSGLNTKGFFGGVFDGRYIYFAPFSNAGGSNGNVLRFDAKLPRAVPATVSGGSNFKSREERGLTPNLLLAYRFHTDFGPIFHNGLRSLDRPNATCLESQLKFY